MITGIVSYGAYIPQWYMPAEQISADAHKLKLNKKSLAGWDEDSVTMAVEAGLAALTKVRVAGSDLGAVYLGSESPPYAVNPSSTIVADVLGATGSYRAVDLQFACKAATAGLTMAVAEVAQKHMDYGLVIGTDKAQAKQGDALEWSAGAAAAAILVGHKKVIATINDVYSCSSDTPDFWRRSEQAYPSHAGRFSGEPGYFAHVVPAAKEIMKRNKLTPKNIDYVVFHMPNGVFPIKAAAMLGFDANKLAAGMTVLEVGNPYSASALLGLAAVLEKAGPKKRILVVAYGSGAGADSMLLTTTTQITTFDGGGVDQQFKQRTQVTHEEYLQRWRWE